MPNMCAGMGKRMRWWLTPLLLILALQHATAQEETVTGEVEVMTVHVPRGSEGDSYFVKLQNDRLRFQLLFDSKPEDIQTGDKLELSVSNPSSDMAAFGLKPLSLGGFDTFGNNTYVVSNYKVKEKNSGKDFAYGAGTVNISSITWVGFTICGRPAGITAQAFKEGWLNLLNPNGKNGTTMENYYNECSYGKLRFDDYNNTIVDMTGIDLPCSGVWNNLNWDANNCNAQEIYGWMNLLETYTTNVLKMDLNLYRRRIAILPEVNCPWAGLGSVGCGRYCYTWIKGGYAAQLDTVFHELGHNLGLQHSTTPGNEYGDGSCAMGGCCNIRCFNAAQSWRAGLSQPKAVLNGSTFLPGVWQRYDLPHTPNNETNHVKVAPSWINSTIYHSYYFSYRTASGWDRGLLGAYAGGISVHVYNGSQFVGAEKSEYQGLLPQGGKYNNTQYGFIVRMLSKNSTFATIMICRYTETVESKCNDGYDNDCDGLFDGADSDCKGKIPPSPPQLVACNKNGICEGPGETALNCPADCPAFCGDGVCEYNRGEDATCTADCPAVCGDCICDIGRFEGVYTVPGTSDIAFGCPRDCPVNCGDGYCDKTRGESAWTCPSDCPRECGDGYCDPRGESAYTLGIDPNGSCQKDCPAVCGDNYCDAARGENVFNCPKNTTKWLLRNGQLQEGDCRGACGDGYCNPASENSTTCARDCDGVRRSRPPVPPPRPPPPRPPPSPFPSPPNPPCPDSGGVVSSPPNSGSLSPPRPASSPPPSPSPPNPPSPSPPPPPSPSPPPPPSPPPLPAPKSSPSPPSPRPPPPSPKPPPSPRPPPSPKPPPRPPSPKPPPRPPPRPPSPKRPPPFLAARPAISDDKATCGNAECEPGENARTCPADCGAVCGDGFCDVNRGERPDNCAKDCDAYVCGNGQCEDAENKYNCPKDCCPKAKCGNGVCEAWGGENCITCPQDCAGDRTNAMPYCCGAFFGCENDHCNEDILLLPVARKWQCITKCT